MTRAALLLAAASVAFVLGEDRPGPVARTPPGAACQRAQAARAACVSCHATGDRTHASPLRGGRCTACHDVERVARGAAIEPATVAALLSAGRARR